MERPRPDGTDAARIDVRAPDRCEADVSDDRRARLEALYRSDDAPSVRLAHVIVGDGRVTAVDLH